MRTLLAISMALLSLSLVGGCAKRYIANTEIEDTEENRNVVKFCERYRHAVNDMNTGLLLSLASPRYFDESGTLKADDDLNKESLEEVLKNRFQSIKSVRYEMRYRDIYQLEDGHVYVEFTYTMSFQYEINGKRRWANKTADNRLKLERAEDSYLILAGM